MSQATIKDYLHHVASKNSSPAAIQSKPTHNGSAEGARVGSAPSSPKPERYRGGGEILQDIPAELQGVSVRDLIKALGKRNIRMCQFRLYSFHC